MRLENNSNIQITDSSLPALFNAADSASIEAQKKYLRFIRADLSFLVLAALLLSFSLPPSLQTLQKITAASSAIFFVISLVLTIIILKTQYERIWYGARAVAESVKTLSWRYMTCSEPFTQNLTSSKADTEFVSKLSKIISERKNLFWSFDGDLGIGSQITDTMRKVRNLDVETRKQIYLQQRIKDQRKWYGIKSKQNRNLVGKWFFAVVFSQLFAIVSAILIIIWPESLVNLAGVFSALAAAFLAWMQVKQHQELAQSYGVAAHELGLVAEQASHVKTNEDLCDFVSDSENAISREHTLWVAKREKLI
jgi:hypothetical protein